jgi:carbamoyl-phosphate synthase/aspartate carbamoyltransferase/dihydroorotase
MEWAHKGTFASETEAALRGGYWAVLDMPNTLPSTIDRPSLDRKLDEIGTQAVCDWGIYLGASKAGNWGEYQSAYTEVCGLKIYNNATTGSLLIDDQAVREEHYRHWTSSKPIAVHAEEETVLDILTLVRKYRRRTHFCHICTAKEIEYLRAAKEERLPITMGITPHHLFLTANDLPQLGAFGLMKPTLKTPKDRDALWNAIDAGVVDVIESDHAPHTLAEKLSAMPPYGVPGLQTTLPLMVTAASNPKWLRTVSWARVKAMLSSNPRRIFGIQIPPETYTVIEPDAEFVIDKTWLRGGWSPFEGMRMRGRVTEVWIRGVKVFDGEQVLVKPGFGRNLMGNAQ